MRVGAKKRLLRQVRGLGRVAYGCADEVRDPAFVAIHEHAEDLPFPGAHPMYQSFVALIMECHLPSIRFLWPLLPRLGAVCYKGGERRILGIAARENWAPPA